MPIHSEPFGTLPTGEAVERYTLTGSGGLTVSVLTFGAILQQVLYQNRQMIRGFDTVAEYLADDSYQGATVGRYAGRIAGGEFELEGTRYSLPINNLGVNCLHGGECGFNRRMWHAQVKSSGNEPSVVLSRLSPSGEEGFPGNLLVSLTVTVTADNTLRLEYRAQSDAPTILNLTNHSYFNLNETGSVGDTVLWIDADAVAPVDEHLIPAGNWLEVTDTPFDFREAKTLARDWDAAHPQLALGDGYDHTYLLNGEGFRRVMSACSVSSGIRMTCFTDQPAAQLYTANQTDIPAARGGQPIGRREAFCFETQHCPDTPHHPAFPRVQLNPGEEFRSVTAYRFDNMED